MIRFGCAKDAAAVYRLICALEDAAFPRARFDQLYLAQCADERIFSLVWEEDGEVIGLRMCAWRISCITARASQRSWS